MVTHGFPSQTLSSTSFCSAALINLNLSVTCYLSIHEYVNVRSLSDIKKDMGFVSRGAVSSTQIQIVSGGSGGGGYPLKSMELRWVSRRKSNKTPDELNKLKSIIPVYISTKASDITLKAEELRELYSTCNHSCHRFPKVDHLGGVEESVDIHKLRIALSHSSILVSVFCNPHHLNFIDTEKEMQTVSVRNLLEKLLPVTPSNGQLVGFGRAVSDLGLTASIYDVMVIPSLRGMGIGRMIVKRIVRLLTIRDIYDIAAVCSENERLFFKACEFGDDILGSTTMMYTRTVSTYSEANQMVKHAGRKLLLVPPLRENL